MEIDFMQHYKSSTCNLIQIVSNSSKAYSKPTAFNGPEIRVHVPKIIHAII